MAVVENAMGREQSAASRTERAIVIETIMYTKNKHWDGVGRGMYIYNFTLLKYILKTKSREKKSASPQHYIKERSKHLSER